MSAPAEKAATEPSEQNTYNYDPGLGTTASCKSAITYLDGDLGQLRYRGYPIETIAGHIPFINTAHLLITGELPNNEQSATFESTVLDAGSQASRMPVAALPAVLTRLAPMDFLHAAAVALATPDTDGTIASYKTAAPRIIGALPLLAAAHARHRNALTPVDPARIESAAGFTERFLTARFGHADPVATKTLDLLFVLHADHEQNCSTTTCRTAASAKAHPYHAVAAAIGALAGPLHGGANEEVLHQLETIHATGNVADTLAAAKRGEQRLMGFGHRVYKNFDPRATIIRKAAHELFQHMGIDDPLLDIAVELETAALADDYFVTRKLYPNVDFYSGLIYRALGFDGSEFTVLFALGRSCGWLAHGIEQLSDPEQRIVRPRQLYVGPQERHPN